MPKIQVTDLEEARRMVAQYEERYAAEKGNPLLSAQALLPIVATVRLLIEEVQKLKAKSI